MIDSFLPITHFPSLFSNSLFTDNVMCPWTDVRSQQDSEPCSRDQACADLECVYPNAVCTVNPCTCEPFYIDINGQRVNCSDGSDMPNYIIDGTSCEKIREQQFKTGSSFFVGCDKDGRFLPIQCNGVENGEETCWCVDEAGSMIANTTIFVRGEKKCSAYGFSFRLSTIVSYLSNSRQPMCFYSTRICGGGQRRSCTRVQTRQR